jgi:type I restriction enzyme S subunit
MEAISEFGKLELQERKYKDVSSGFTYFADDDVVLAKITPCYENGKAGVMKGLKNGFGFGTTEFMVMRPSNKILSSYLYYVIFSDKFRKMGEVEMRGTAGQKRVTSSFVMNYELSIPDIKTQEKIVTELDIKMQMFAIAIAKVENSIAYLKEFKTSLISNVVTGKIKV